MLFYNTIHSETLELLKKLQSEDVFSDLRLVGGTSLALQLVHRISVDLDLFGNLQIDKVELNKILTKLAQIELLQETENIHIYNIENIKVDFVNYHYPWLKPDIRVDGLSLASIEDIAAINGGNYRKGKQKRFYRHFFHPTGIQPE